MKSRIQNPIQGQACDWPTGYLSRIENQKAGSGVLDVEFLAQDHAFLGTGDAHKYRLSTQIAEPRTLIDITEIPVIPARMNQTVKKFPSPVAGCRNTQHPEIGIGPHAMLCI